MASADHPFAASITEVRRVANAWPRAGFFASLTRHCAALHSALWLQEPPRAYHALAFGLIAAGIVVTSRQP